MNPPDQNPPPYGQHPFTQPLCVVVLLPSPHTVAYPPHPQPAHESGQSPENIAPETLGCGMAIFWFFAALLGLAVLMFMDVHYPDILPEKRFEKDYRIEFVMFGAPLMLLILSGLVAIPLTLLRARR